jgi:hypothetical protein
MLGFSDARREGSPDLLLNVFVDIASRDCPLRSTQGQTKRRAAFSEELLRVHPLQNADSKAKGGDNLVIALRFSEFWFRVNHVDSPAGSRSSRQAELRSRASRGCQSTATTGNF